MIETFIEREDDAERETLLAAHMNSAIGKFDLICVDEGIPMHTEKGKELWF